MNNTAELEISALAAALSLGILADVLLRTTPWGLNCALWCCALTAAITYLGQARREVFGGGGHWLVLAMAFPALTMTWRDSSMLNALSVFALLTSASLAMLRAQGRHLRVSSLTGYTVSAIIAGMNSALGMFPLLFGAREWKKSFNGETRRGGALTRGTLFSLIPLLVFGALFAGADAVFKALVGRIFEFDFSHILLIVFVAFAVGGYLRGLLFGKELKLADGMRVPPPSLGMIETAVILGLLDLLFLAFVIIQIRYFFGGAALVHGTTGLTYSEYARSGFFRLLAVAVILLPFLLLIHWLLPSDNASAQRTFRWLAGVQIGLLFVVMASAVERMRLYVSEYGLSEQRLYPVAFMGWLAVVFIWFCITVMRGDRERFAFGAMVAGFLLVATLHIINPDALIARTNMARGSQGRTFDAGYAASLSDDAVPELAGGFPAMNRQDRCTVAVRMVQRLSELQNSDWRSWTYSRYRARKVLRENESALHAAVCCKPR